MRRFLLVVCLACMGLDGWAQFPNGTTGLLHMPTAEMQRDKTFMAGASYLNKKSIPMGYSYNTYNYYVNITIMPFLEVAYTCTLMKPLLGKPGFSEEKQNRFTNQDRSFSVRLRLLEEGQFWKYMPAVLIGGNDVLTSGGAEDKGYMNPSGMGNGYWNRYYLALTKHVPMNGIGEWGVHLAYVYNNRKAYHLNGPCVGLDFSPSFHTPLNFMAEYDSRTINIGMKYSIWKDHINLIGELNQCKYPSVGIYFKVHLK